MSEATRDGGDGVDESAFGSGGESSHDSDVDAGFDDRDDQTAGAVGAAGGADERVPDSHTADVDAGFEDRSDSPTSDVSDDDPGFDQAEQPG